MTAFRCDLFGNASLTGNPIGTSISTYTTTGSGTTLLTLVAHLAHGDIVATGLYEGPQSNMAISGGTGIFTGVTGSLNAAYTDLTQTVFLLTFRYQQ